MDLNFSVKNTKDTPKLIQWVVFIAIIAAFGWCFWIYWSTTQSLKETGTSTTTPPATINQQKLDEVLAADRTRAQNFATPPSIPYNPF